MKKILVSLIALSAVVLAVVAFWAMNQKPAMLAADPQPYPGAVNFTVLNNSGQPIANAICTEVNVAWHLLPEGESYPRTCTTDSSGNCQVANLMLGRVLLFKCDATGFRTEAHIRTTDAQGKPMLRLGNPTLAWEVHLQAAGNPGDLIWQNFIIAFGASRNVTGSVYQNQADGTLKAVSAADGLTCTISAGPNMVNADIDCTLLSGLAVGCGSLTASLKGKSVISIVRVTNPDGSGEYCKG